MREVALLTSAGGDGLATVVDVLTGTQITSLKNCSAQPGSTALIAGDFVVSAQVGGWAGGWVVSSSRRLLASMGWGVGY